MKIGILGTGNIGRTLARKLGAAGHDVKAANSRGPETIDAGVLAFGARAVTAAKAVADVDVVILSMPLVRLADVAPLISNLPTETTVIDTSNYYPGRDGTVDAIEAGEVESVWVSRLLGHPIAKAWNCIGASSFERKGQPAGSPGRIALPVAADRDDDRKTTMALVEATGFTAFDAGPLSDSWRQQPGAPCYCTDLDRDELPAALAAAERARLPKRRDLTTAVMTERFGNHVANADSDYRVRLARTLYM
ncbi:NADPH-dependent F420 reductase [Pleomorphomonas carboxyditropha]|uniref:NADP oxidoreductase n=1 Tax=Pleomorphomonas carboxyditropha TaxID=2023338 RepID=A0A2G9WNG5_9HYPH|nr:NAD(P)-binding domain-containing protein [Pleomorphomonas carboxyditropha]PIO96205.1 NADP oxidoreductase [Pleomorphomonas carboxyditropha]